MAKKLTSMTYCAWLHSGTKRQPILFSIVWQCKWPSLVRQIVEMHKFGYHDNVDISLFLSVKNRVSVRQTADITIIFHLETILSFPFLETSAFIACRVLQCIRKPYWLICTHWNNCNFFCFLLVRLFADFQFLAKLLVKEVPQVTERTNEVILCFHIRTTSLCAGCLMWSNFICIY